ncbi:MAG: tetratricopeptide repeat protein [Deltaproteobacteria bacterium]|nr:tetratricopeptide repeat protein [Deltaproteobacteria bacterium]
MEKMICRRLRSFPDFNTISNPHLILEGVVLWEELEVDLIRFDISPSILSQLKEAVFTALTNAADLFSLEDLVELTGPDTVASWYYYAGRFEKALDLDETAIGGPTPASSQAYVRTGDFHYRQGDEIRAREYYREAFYRDPGKADITSVADERVSNFIIDLIEDEEIPKPPLLWAAPVGLIRGIFPFPRIYTRDQFLVSMEEYKNLSAIEPTEGLTQARLFYSALILVEEARWRDISNTYDPIVLRREMKRLSPHLFGEYLSNLGLFNRGTK